MARCEFFKDRRGIEMVQFIGGANVAEQKSTDELRRKYSAEYRAFVDAASQPAKKAKKANKAKT